MTAPSDDLCWVCRQHPIDGSAPTVVGLPPSLCTTCATHLTRPHRQAWETLSRYLQAHWKDIVRRGSFDLSQVFRSDVPRSAVQVHLHFVALLGCKLRTEQVGVDLTGFASALLQGVPHPEVTLLVADGTPDARRLRAYDSEVSVLRRDDEVYSALWMYLEYPLAVKACYLKQSAPVSEPDGFPWHPTRQRKLVKLSPYKGDTRPIHARRDLRM